MPKITRVRTISDIVVMANFDQIPDCYKERDVVDRIKEGFRVKMRAEKVDIHIDYSNNFMKLTAHGSDTVVVSSTNIATIMLKAKSDKGSKRTNVDSWTDV